MERLVDVLCGVILGVSLMVGVGMWHSYQHLNNPAHQCTWYPQAK